MIRYDVAIAGAGPAGSVLALLAARAGYRVLLAERSRFDNPRFGETAPPELRVILARVGLEHLAQPPFCREAPEVLSVWGGVEPTSRHHIFSPYGAALHLDRRAFDEALALAARDAGADLKLGCAVRFGPQSPEGHIVQLPGEHARSNFAILAAGRAAGGLGLPYVRHYLDTNVGVAAHFSPPAGNFDSRTLIEAVPGGWIYFAALPSNTAIVVFVTSASLVPSERRARLRWWLEALAQTNVVRKALNWCRLPESVSVMDARGSYAKSGGGERWLAVGDARIAPDPLCGQGIIWAIDDAVSVVELLGRSGWHALAEEMRARTKHEVERYLVDRSYVYSSEKRFGSAPFWRSAPGHPPIYLQET